MLKHSMTADNEIMGYCYGRAIGNSFYLLDVLSLSVVGTETRVKAGDDAMQDTYEYEENAPLVGRHQWNTAWYHSHPGLFPFLSNIDIMTERLCQSEIGYRVYTALVIDPKNTASSGRLHLGSYCTYPPPKGPDGQDAPDPVVDLPQDLLLKYGAGANLYYELDLKYFTTPTDKKVLADIITRSYGAAIGCSPLRLNAEDIGTRVSEVAAGFSQLSERPGELGRLARTIGRVNEDRRTGIWLERMKKAAFG
jgi:COP9 signalosome complex subunit 5